MSKQRAEAEDRKVKTTLKNIIDEYSVDKIPEGKENEYFSNEKLLEISRRLKAIAFNQMILISSLIVALVVRILKWFIEFSRWIEILFFVFATIGIISVVISAIQYSRFKKSIEVTPKDS